MNLISVVYSNRMDGTVLNKEPLFVTLSDTKTKIFLALTISILKFDFSDEKLFWLTPSVIEKITKILADTTNEGFSFTVEKVEGL